MRNHNIDKFRLISAIMVVLIHSTSFLSEIDDNFLIYQSYRFVLNIAVVYFFAVTGYYIAEKKSLSYVKKTSVNIFHLYIFSSFIYLVIRVLLATLNRLMNGISFKNSIIGILNGMSFIKLIDGTFGSYHLWYLASLIICLLLFYVFLKKEYSGIVILILSFTLYCFKKFEIIPSLGIFSNFRFVDAMISMSLGYAIKDYDFKISRPLLTSSVSLLIYGICNWLNIVDFKNIFLWVSVSGLLIYFVGNPGYNSFISKYTKYSSQIYIMHVFILDFLNIALKSIGINRLDNIFLYISFVTIISIVLSPLTYKVCKYSYSKLVSIFI